MEQADGNRAPARDDRPAQVLTDADAKRMIASPEFQALVAGRDRLGFGVVLVTIAMYFGYLALLAFAPGLMRSHLTASVTMGFPIGFGVIVATILLTAFTVWRASAGLEPLRLRLLRSAGR